MNKLLQIKFKRITQDEDVFLYRVSLKFRQGTSWKLHIIVGDDKGEPHQHPWNFTSFLLLGAYKELVEEKMIRRWPFQIVKNECTEKHKVLLYRLLGYKIPCVTVGKYSEKIQPWCERSKLCDMCKSFGYCLDKKYWSETQPQ